MLYKVHTMHFLIVWPLWISVLTPAEHSINPNQDGLFGPSKGWGGGLCPPRLFELFQPHFSSKSTKQGHKWKLASLSTCRVFEHHPKLDSLAVRWRRNSLLWPWKFPDFRYYNFWIFVNFDLHGQYVHQMKAENILKSNLTWKNTIYYKKFCKKWVFQNFRFIFDGIFFSKSKIFIYNPPNLYFSLVLETQNENYMKVWYS